MGKSKIPELIDQAERISFSLEDSMEKFNQLARRFSTRKDSTGTVGKYSRQTTYVSLHLIEGTHLADSWKL
jgi:hypothetical protein